MNELKPEYEKIRDTAVASWAPCSVAGGGLHAMDAIRKAVTDCQSLADRPPKMLSDDEVQNIFHMLPGGVDGFLREYGYLKFADMLQHAFIAKQSEPDTVPFDYEKWSKGGWQAIDSKGEDAYLIKPQENYTMRKSA